MSSKQNKWTKVNIYTQQAEKIEDYLEDPAVCSKFGILSKSNFVQNAVRREIKRIEEEIEQEKAPITKKKSTITSEATEMAQKIENTGKKDSKEDFTISNYGMGAIMRRMDTKKEIERIAKANTNEVELKTKIKTLESQLNSKKEKQRALEEKIEALKSKKIEKKENTSKQNKILQELKQKLEEKDKQTSQLSKELSKLKKKVEDKEKKTEKYEKQLEELKSAKEELEKLKEKMRLEEIQRIQKKLDEEKLKQQHLSNQIADFHDKMEQASKDMLFEKAAEFRDKINMAKNELEDVGRHITSLEREFLAKKRGKNEIQPRKSPTKRKIKSPPPPKMPPGPKKQTTLLDLDEEDESNIVDVLYGDEGADADVLQDTNDPINQVNELLKNGFMLENSGKKHKASKSFMQAAELLEEIVAEAEINTSDRQDLVKKIDSYKEHALYLRNS